MGVVELLCSLFPYSTGQSSLEPKFCGLEFTQKWLVEEPPSPSTDFPLTLTQLVLHQHGTSGSQMPHDDTHMESQLTISAG